MIKQFEVGKSYYRELPSNPNFASCLKNVKRWVQNLH